MALAEWFMKFRNKLSKYRKNRMERRLLLMEQYKLEQYKYGEISIKSTPKFERNGITQSFGETKVKSPTKKLYGALGRATTQT